MIYKATREIEKAIKADELHYEIDETEHTSVVSVGFDGKVAKNLTVRFISRDDDNDFSVRCFSIANTPEEKMDVVLKAVNEANDQYRYAKFVVDEDGDINAEYDFPVAGDNIGDSATELLVRFVDIIDKCYPKFMSAIWG